MSGEHSRRYRTLVVLEQEQHLRVTLAMAATDGFGNNPEQERGKDRRIERKLVV